VKQVLVVDDSAVIRKIARRILEAMEFGASEASSGKAALAECAKAMPDVILLDWNMPEMDGVEFLSALRKMPGGGAPKVVFCTCENEAGQFARARHAGADDYLMKPFDENIVRSRFAEIGLL
jgi:two-component system chemotaxis response regulator CheY